MTTTYNLSLNQYNGEDLGLTFTEADPNDSGTPLSLVGATINFVIKASKTTPDSSAIAILTTGSAGGVTITNATDGLATVTIPPSALALQGAFWWRADVLFNGVPKTAGYGYLNVTPM
jgi:hypothetical protein